MTLKDGIYLMPYGLDHDIPMFVKDGRFSPRYSRVTRALGTSSTRVTDTSDWTWVAPLPEPPRMAEPGVGGIVMARDGGGAAKRVWVRVHAREDGLPSNWWVCGETVAWREWVDLIDPRPLTDVERVKYGVQS